MYINNYISWQNNKINLNGRLLLHIAFNGTSDILLQVYHQSGINYPKFFKMDMLSRLAFLCSELLAPYAEIDKQKVATVISTRSGCIEVDKKFEESRKTIASPALFVYTLPNIMLGEICIRHGFKGEQICTIEEKASVEMLQFQVWDLLQHRGTEACLCGHVEATEQSLNATVLWVSKGKSTEDAVAFSSGNLEKIFANHE